MGTIVNRRGWKAVILVATIVAGCESAATENPDRARPLTALEMDQVTAGSATAASNGAAQAAGIAPQTAVSTNTMADATGSLSPIGVALLSSASSSLMAVAGNGSFVQANGAGQLQVNGGSGGAGISAAGGSAASANQSSNNASVSMQLTGLSMSHVDLAYGSVSAAACCNASEQAEADLDSTAGGPYTNKLQAEPISDAPAGVQTRIDAAVASSTLPLLNAGQAAAVIAPDPRQGVDQ